MTQKIIFWLAILCVKLSQAKKGIPPYITVCQRSDPNFEKCYLDSAHKALPYIIKGDRKYKVPSFQPLKISKLSYTTESGLAATAKDVQFFGFENVKIEKLKIDLEKKYLELNMFVDTLKIDAEYEFHGSFLFVILNATGNTTNTLKGYRSAISMNYSLITKEDGKEYAELGDPEVRITFEDAQFWFDNVFPGSPDGTKVINDVLNHYWKLFLDDFQPLLKDITVKIGMDLVKNVASNNPFDEIFPK